MQRGPHVRGAILRQPCNARADGVRVEALRKRKRHGLYSDVLRKPVSGLEAAAIVSSCARPASSAARPASTPKRKAAAMRTGLPAVAMAVLTKTASAPISIAAAACEGTPK